MLLLTNKQPPFHLFSFPQLHLGFFRFFTFTAWHEFWVLCLAFSELDGLAKWSWRHFSMPLITRVSFTAFWVLYLVLPGLENCNLVLFTRSYSSSFHFAGSVNVCLLPTPFPRFSAPFFPLSTACFFLSAFDVLRFFLGGAILKCYMILLMRTLTGNSSA